MVLYKHEYPVCRNFSRIDKNAANPGTTEWYQSGNNVNFYFFAVNQTAVYRVNASNECGCTTYDFGFKSTDCSGGGGCNPVYTLSPNPSNSKVTIIPQIPAPCGITTATVSQTGLISVYDQQGTLKKKIKYVPNSKAEIDVSDLQDGTYFLQINDGNSTDKKTFVVQH